MNKEINRLIKEYFKSGFLKKRLLKSIEETRRDLAKRNVVLTDDLILEGLKTLIDIAENEAIRKRNANDISIYLDQALKHNVFKKYILLYAELKKMK